MQAILILFYLTATVWAIFSVIFHGSRPSRSLSWVLCVLLFPFLGPLLYYLFGVNRRKFKFYKLKGNLRRQLYDKRYSKTEKVWQETSASSSELERLSLMLQNSSNNPIYPGNEVEVLHSGRVVFDTIFETIAAAKKFIHIQYYIFEKGELQDTFFKLLKKKVSQGVEVRILYDSYGSMAFRGKLRKRFADIGVEIFAMMPLRMNSFMYTLNYRNHRKIVVVDGEVGFVGGMNVSDMYLNNKGDLGIWRDVHLKITGPAVNSLHRIFIKDFHFASKQPPLMLPKYLPEITSVGTVRLQLIPSGPDSDQPSIFHQYISMIHTAEKCIRIANPYFIPGPSVLTAIKIAALGGIKVKLLVPGKSDSFLAKYSMLSNFEALLKVGVEIYVRKDFSHSKVILMDKDVASVGTGNFDHRSFEHNFETNALIYDRDIANNLCITFDTECEKAVKFELKDYLKRSKIERFKERLARFFSPLL